MQMLSPDNFLVKLVISIKQFKFESNEA
jgi:hypothetical protein